LKIYQDFVGFGNDRVIPKNDLYDVFMVSYKTNNQWLLEELVNINFIACEDVEDSFFQEYLFPYL
jgi:hypothetical protein